MTQHKKVVEALRDCFARQDWNGMLPMLTDDVERWEVGAPKRTRGKREFEDEMRPGENVTRLADQLFRLVEEGNVVVAEGKVQVFKKDGSVTDVQYCNVHEFEGERVKRITSYGNVV